MCRNASEGNGSQAGKELSICAKGVLFTQSTFASASVSTPLCQRENVAFVRKIVKKPTF